MRLLGITLFVIGFIGLAASIVYINSGVTPSSIAAITASSLAIIISIFLISWKSFKKEPRMNSWQITNNQSNRSWDIDRQSMVSSNKQYDTTQKLNQYATSDSDSDSNDYGPQEKRAIEKKFGRPQCTEDYIKNWYETHRSSNGEKWVQPKKKGNTLLDDRIRKAVSDPYRPKLWVLMDDAYPWDISEHPSTFSPETLHERYNHLDKKSTLTEYFPQHTFTPEEFVMHCYNHKSARVAYSDAYHNNASSGCNIL